MLAQPTQRIEPLSARAQRAPINLLLVPRARKVLIERYEALILPMAQVAFVRVPVPRSAGRDVRDFAIARRSRRGGPGEETRGVGDDPVDVFLADDAVDDGAVDSRAAGPRLEVEDQGGLRDEALPALVARADNFLGAMDGGVHVAPQIVFVLEESFAGNAVAGRVQWRLSVMLVQPGSVLEHAVAWSAPEVRGFVVVFEVIIVLEVDVAVLTVGVSSGLDPVFFEPSPGVKIDIAVIAPVVVGRVAQMLPVLRVVVEVAAAAGDHGVFVAARSRMGSGITAGLWKGICCLGRSD